MLDKKMSFMQRPYVIYMFKVKGLYFIKTLKTNNYSLLCSTNIRAEFESIKREPFL